MFAGYILGFSFLAAFTLSVLMWLFRGTKKLTTIPGMQPSTKEGGNLPDIIRAGSFHEFLTQLHARYGPISGFWFGQVYTVSIASPELFKQHTHASERPPILYRLFEPTFGSASILYTNGEEFRIRKRQYDRAFGHTRLSSYFHMFQKATDRLVENWSKKEPGDYIPLCEDTFVFAVRAALFTILGEYFEDDGLMIKFKTAYETVWSEQELRMVDPVLPEPGSERMNKFEEAVNYMRSSVRQVLQHRKDTVPQDPLLIDDVIEHAASEEILECDVISYLVASFHTTGNLLAWCLYYLATHEQVQQRAYEEIVGVLGQEDLVTDSNIDRFQYTHQVINESLRCGVVGPWGSRYQETDCLLGGHHIPKFTPVIHAFGVVMEDSKLWPAPDKFDPDRFDEANSKARHPYAFCPFGFAGKRKCPAYRYSYLESTVLLASILRRFHVGLQVEQQVKHVYGFVTHPDVEIWVKVTKRT